MCVCVCVTCGMMWGVCAWKRGKRGGGVDRREMKRQDRLIEKLKINEWGKEII